MITTKTTKSKTDTSTRDPSTFPEFPIWPELKWQRLVVHKDKTTSTANTANKYAQQSRDGSNHNTTTSSTTTTTTTTTTTNVVFVGYLRACIAAHDKNSNNQRTFIYHAVDNASISQNAPCGYFHAATNDKNNNNDPTASMQQPQLQPPPLIRMVPGNKYKLVLINHSDQPTNLHTHGLHVSGVGIGDDITRTVDPGMCTVYDYDILDDADVGTHWYHAHRFPLSSYQVAHGAYGMLIVDETPQQLQQYPIPLQHFLDPRRQVILQFASVVDKSTKKPHKRTNYVNGRAINTTTTTSTSSSSSKAKQKMSSPLHLSWKKQQWYYVRISSVVISDPINFVQMDPPTACEIRVVAYDGVYRSKIPHEISNHVHMLSLSSRVDLAIKCHSDANIYFHQGQHATTPFDPESNFLRLVQIHVVNVDSHKHHNDDNNNKDARSFQDASPYWDDETQTQWEPRRPYYLPNLQALDNSSGSSITKDDLWNVTMDTFHDGNGRKHLSINHHQWDPHTPIRAYPLQQIVEWDLYNTHKHPFHIHINRMQIVQPGGCGYRYEEGEYYDTIAAKATKMTRMVRNKEKHVSLSSCRVRLQFWNFAGRVVAHCHKLKHEDRGMMVWLNITDGPGAGMEGMPHEECFALSLV